MNKLPLTPFMMNFIQMAFASQEAERAMSKYPSSHRRPKPMRSNLPKAKKPGRSRNKSTLLKPKPLKTAALRENGKKARPWPTKKR